MRKFENWSEDEFVLLLNHYFRYGGVPPKIGSKAGMQLSEALKQINEVCDVEIDHKVSHRFRSINAIRRKVMETTKIKKGEVDSKTSIIHTKLYKYYCTRLKELRQKVIEIYKKYNLHNEPTLFNEKPSYHDRPYPCEVQEYELEKLKNLKVKLPKIKINPYKGTLLEDLKDLE